MRFIVLARDAFRKVAALGHETLSPDSNFSYARLFKDQHGSPGKSYLSLIWLKMLQARGWIGEEHTSLEKLIPLAREHLSRIPHPAGQSIWHFFLDSPDNSDRLEKFWQAISDRNFSFLWKNPDSLGWLFQYYVEPGLDIFRSPNAPKIQDRHMALRTQQFTPRWIADFLVQNTLGRLWLQMHPKSRLVSRWPYLVPLIADPPPPKCKSADQIKILDPACGTMHLGLAVIDALKPIYREELQNAGKPGWPDRPSIQTEADIPAAILQNNLFGIDIDPLALELAALTLSFTNPDSGNHQRNLLQTNALKNNLGTRLRKANFPDAFDIILLNPPYLDKRDYNAKLKAYMARNFKDSGRNLYTAFLERVQSLLAPGGRLGAITPQTFMFIHSFDALRQKLLDQAVIETLAHTGLNTFEDAVVDCAFYVLRREDDSATRQNSSARYLHLTTPTTPEEKHRQLLERIEKIKCHPDNQYAQVYTYRQADFAALPGAPWVYWVGRNIRHLFRDLPALGQIAQLRQGLATTENRRFLRYWWEIPSSQIAFGCRGLEDARQSGKKWFPYLKGGGFRKWYGMQYFLVNWADDGREIKEEIVRRYPYLKGDWQWVAKNSEFYFREGVNYSYLTSGKFSARYSPPGFIFDVAGSSIFADTPMQILGILNSRFCRFALGLINHTVNFQVGDLKRLPIPDETSPQLNDLVLEAIDQTRRLETFDEISPHFVAPPPWPEGCEIVANINSRLDEIQRQIDDEVYRLYDLSPQDRHLIEQYTGPDDPTETITIRQLAGQWIAYAVGIALGRHKPQSDILSLTQLNSPFCPLLPDDNLGLAARVRFVLDTLLGTQQTQDIIQQAAGSDHLHPWLASDFFAHHFSLACQRPFYWLLKRNKKLFAVYYQNLNAENLNDFLPVRKTAIPFDFDDGILANMKQIKSYFAIPAWQRRLK
jgi:hypothetical protein